VTVHQTNGKREIFVILDCKLVPGLWINLFGITSSLHCGWSISNEGIIITLRRHEQSVVFDQVLESSTGAITGVIMEPVLFPEYNNVGVPIPTVQEDEASVLNDLNAVKVFPDPDSFVEQVPDAPPPDIDPSLPHPVVTWDVNDLHSLLGHALFDAIKRSAKYYEVKLSRTVKTCVACDLAKIRQKNINKVTLSKCFHPGARIYIDISSSMWPSYGGAKYWLLIVDDYSHYCWSYFVFNKSGLKIMMVLFLKLMTVAYNIHVEKICLDNSGENVDMAELICAEGYNVTFEFISPGAPQYNGVVERMFSTLYGMVHSMLNQAQVPLHICCGVWAEAAKTATDMRNILVNYKSN
jgi:hypothetical protein